MTNGYIRLIFIKKKNIIKDFPTTFESNDTKFTTYKQQ